MPQASIQPACAATNPMPALRSRGGFRSSQGILVGTLRGLFDLVLFVIPIGLLIAAVEIPLPMVKHKEVENVRTALFIGVIAFWFSWSYSRRRWSAHRIVRQSIAGQSIGSISVLDSLYQASTEAAAERLLKLLSEAAPGAFRNSASSLADLARAVDHVARMVPTGVRTSIPPAVWDVGPAFTLADFRAWLGKFDKRYPGRLSWLAAKHQGLIAKALDRAEMLVGDVRPENHRNPNM